MNHLLVNSSRPLSFWGGACGIESESTRLYSWLAVDTACVNSQPGGIKRQIATKKQNVCIFGRYTQFIST
mgnify:CR=1 FL=1